MGRYSLPLAVKFLDVIGPQRGQRALDVGCGTGIVTAELVERLGPEAVAAIDPSAPVRQRRAPDACPTSTCARVTPRSCRSTTTRSTSRVAQLVVHFMADPRPRRRRDGAGRPTRRGRSPPRVWDVHGGGSPLAVVLAGRARVRPDAPWRDSRLPGADDADLVRIFERRRPATRRAGRAHRAPLVRQLRGAGGSPTCCGVGPAATTWRARRRPRRRPAAGLRRRPSTSGRHSRRDRAGRRAPERGQVDRAVLGVVRVPVSLVLAKLISDATRRPACPSTRPCSTSTRISVAFGSSGPSGSQASAKVFHSSSSFSVSSTTVARPVTRDPGVARRERHRHPRFLLDRAHVRGVAGGDEPQLRARLDLLAGHRHAAADRPRPNVVIIAIGHVLHQLDQLLRVAVLVHVTPSLAMLAVPRASRARRAPKSGGAVG